MTAAEKLGLVSQDLKRGDMAKYDGLIAHLTAVPGNVEKLSFSRIEQIIADRLPPSARAHAAWWANSSPNDSHSWAHAWQAAGWKAHVQIANGTVEFRRAAPTLTSQVDALRPRTKHNVIDLVGQAGIDVTAWAYVDDQPYPTPASNPKFCYDWSFGSPQEGYVICVWHQSLEERNGRVIYQCDMGTHTRKLRSELLKTGVTDSQRARLVKQIKRAEAFETAVTNSYYASRPLRLILNLGNMRADDEADTASIVSERELDTQGWFVHSLADGDALIVRGEPPATLQALPGDGTGEPPETPGEDDKWREAQIRVRQGQPEFRTKLLAAYARRCAVTGSALEGVLEAAHIVPHAEGTDYRTSNGLLLRADIHTLFDLYHLSVDERGEIHLSRAALQSEYRQFHGKRIRLPEKATQQPSPTSLASRHARFLERERQRI